jgi:hypothetical protein
MDRVMATTIIDGITTRYEVIGSGPPLLMYAPAGFDATAEKRSTQGVYAKLKLLDHLPKKYTCVVFDRPMPLGLAKSSTQPTPLHRA